MLLNKTGQKIVIDGIAYTIGMNVRGTDASVYEGLRGIILEIRDGEDKETENETADIVCCFEPPTNSFMIKHVEKRFSALYGEKKEIGDIALDYVVMAPEMIHIE